jgi:hypothetical protein
MKPFEESDRFNYPLTGKSTVMIVGAHKGKDAVIFYERYGCTILAYEPIQEFFYELSEVAAHRRSVEHFRYKCVGLGKQTGEKEFVVKGEMSGPWADQGEKQRVNIIGIGSEMDWLEKHPTIGTRTVDLASINCEAGEFELLEAILDEGLARRFTHLSIQFHFIPALNPVERWRKIRDRLAETHRLMYADPSMEPRDNSWEGWSLR